MLKVAAAVFQRLDGACGKTSESPVMFAVFIDFVCK